MGLLDTNKDELRRRALARRGELADEQRRHADACILRQLLAHPAYAAAGTVLAYLSVGSETDTRVLVQKAWQDGKVVAAPRCVPGTRRMQWYRIESFEGLERSPFGIDEPAANPGFLIDPATPSMGAGSLGANRVEGSDVLAIVPGLAFDTEGFRIGYGGGFYDVFLAGFPGTSLGLCPRAQLSPKPLPRGPYDVPVNVVLTEDGPVASW